MVAFICNMQLWKPTHIDFYKNEWDCKPGSVVNDHLSGINVTANLKRPTWEQIGQIYGPLFGLASDGVYICPGCYHPGGSLLHCLSTLTVCTAVYFCCTILGVASTGRYPASCPVKPGLSSPATLRTDRRDHLSHSVLTNFIHWNNFRPQILLQ